MAKITLAHGTVSFKCPGCGDHHTVNAGPAEGPRTWKWNGSVDAPTLHPSILVRSGHYASAHKPGDKCWCTFKAEGNETSFSCYRCHSFVRNGQIEFLADCTHALAGQTVNLPELEPG